MAQRGEARRPKTPGAIYGVLSLVMILVVGVIALKAVQPPPPQIAEFAPQAVEQIRDAPDEQSGREDGGSGVLPPVGSSLLPIPPPSTPLDVPRYRRCYGNPPRQTEDPQSPPCAAYWDPRQDNGAKTWRGVDRNEIRIAWPQSIEKNKDTFLLEQYFNLRYEFYGRKIKLVPYKPTGEVFGPWDQAGMLNDADRVRDEADAFASLAYIPRAGAEHHYYDRLAQHRIVSVDSHASQRTEAHLQRFAPYEWMYLPSFDVMMRNFGEWICKSLAGRRPAYAGTVIASRSTPRTFGLVYHRAAEGSTPDRSLLLSTLRDGCGVAPAVTTEYTTPEQAALKLKTADVTTVICLCQGDQYFELMPEATTQVYFPEWLVSSYHYLDYDSAAQRYPNEHQDHVLGITFHNKWLSQKEMPWYQAIKEVEPTYETGDDGYASSSYERYYEMLVLASGIQMAGPNLTPKTFAEGLYRARFPAAGSGREPLWHPGGGFGPRDHSMVDDATMIWY
ncbi:MAG: hypothetical protein ACRDJM_09730, partial [Actinomycetota bacterium]